MYHFFADMFPVRNNVPVYPTANSGPHPGGGPQQPQHQQTQVRHLHTSISFKTLLEEKVCIFFVLSIRIGTYGAIPQSMACFPLKLLLNCGRSNAINSKMEIV